MLHGQSNGHVRPEQRFTHSRRCPICGGCDVDARGSERRCYGFRSDRFVHCTREDRAGDLKQSEAGTFAHRLYGPCGCGTEHNPHDGLGDNIVATYPYYDEHGVLLKETVRCYPKSFKQRRPDGNGGWIWNAQGVRRTLYRLPELLAASPDLTVYWVEGEKDCDNLRGLGLLEPVVATTSAMGARSLRAHIEGARAALAGRNVVVIADADSDGRDYAAKVAAAISNVVASVRVIEMPNAKDVSDWIDAGGTLWDLTNLVEAATPKSRAAPTEPPDTNYKLTELGNAERFAAKFCDRLRYVQSWKKWLNWDGTRWCRDEIGIEIECAKAIPRDIYAEAAEHARLAAQGDERFGERAKELTKWAHRSAAAYTLRATAVLAQSAPPIAARAGSFDTNPMVLNVRNGTIDLRTGSLRDHDRADMLTQIAPVDFDRTAKCPTWLAFLARVLPDLDVRSFVQRFIGYCLSGDVGEQVLVFFYGIGANGKSTLLGVIQDILGDYALQGSPGLLLASDRGGEDLGRRQRAALRGRRLVLCQEIEAGRYLNEAQVKQITGGDKITAARLYEDETEFAPTHKLVVAANHKPQVRGQDHAIWRRIRLVPFTVTIPENERDPNLAAKLKAEAPGILRWALSGCTEWQRSGLGAPSAVLEATNTYKSEEDRLGDFLAAHTVRVPVGFVPSSTLHSKFIAWCEVRGERPWSMKAFTSALTERGLDRDVQRVAGEQVRGFRGVALRTNEVL